MAGHRIRARSPKFHFPEQTEKHWFGGSVFKTHWLNSYTLVIPDGEKFIHRTTKKFLDLVDPTLREQVLGLLGQEISHSREHEKFFENLSGQGYRIKGFLSFYRFVFYGVLEKVVGLALGPKFILSTAAAIEHINAVIAEVGLSNAFLEDADPDVRPLFEWHYAEEIEHKTVVYDVLQRVAPSYFVRAIGLLFAFVTFLGVLAIGTLVLVAQDGRLFAPSRDAAKFFFTKERFVPRMLGALVDYLRPGFHPDQRDNERLSEEAFQRLGSLSTGSREETSIAAPELPRGAAV